jgi:predicted nucleic acid-binding protein
VKKKAVLDAYALVAYLTNEGGHTRVRDMLASEHAAAVVNSVNIGEVFSVLARARGIRQAEHFLSVILPSLPVGIVENSLDDVIAAARIKAAHALSFADCFAAATAIKGRAPLVTGDPEFKKLGKALEIDWIA